MTIRHTSHPLRGAPPVERAAGVAVGGGLRFDPLSALWRHLESYPRLSSRFAVHRGIRWTSPNGARPNEAGAGRRRGLHGARRARQFRLPDPVSVGHRQGRPRRGTGLPWDRDKLVVTATRPTRGPWRIAAGLDREGLVCSEQFFALWPKGPVPDAQLPAFAAVLNGPVASAFLAAHAPAKGSCLAALKDVPIPPALPARAAELAADYARRLRGTGDGGFRRGTGGLADPDRRRGARGVRPAGASRTAAPRRFPGLGAPGRSCVAPLGRADSGPRPHPGRAAVGAFSSTRELDSRRVPAVADGVRAV